jgi:release factor glutamine methyltransferase
MTIDDALKEATRILKTSGIDEARRDAVSLLFFTLERDRAFLLVHNLDVVDEKNLESYFSSIERRAAGEPLQYITGRQEFFGLDFEVTPDVLIPRPETEILVEAALELIDQDEEAFICDVGIGSGCIVVSLLRERKLLKAYGLDISSAALKVAARNAARHGVDERLALFESDCFSALTGKDLKFDLIVSNPPYVTETDFQTLQREVRAHEPRIALTPGGDGLSVVQKLLTNAPRHLKPNGRLLIEIGYDQSESVQEMIDARVWTLIEIRKDLQQIPRMVVLRNAQ